MVGSDMTTRDPMMGTVEDSASRMTEPTPEAPPMEGAPDDEGTVSAVTIVPAEGGTGFSVAVLRPKPMAPGGASPTEPPVDVQSIDELMAFLQQTLGG